MGNQQRASLAPPSPKEDEGWFDRLLGDLGDSGHDDGAADTGVLDFGAGVLEGAGEGLYDTISGIKDLGLGAWNITGGWLTDPEQASASWKTFKDTTKAVWDDPKQLVDAVTAPIQEDWSEGRYGEAVGRSLFEVAGVLLGTKGVDKAGKAGKVSKLGGVIDDVADVSKLDDVADVSKLDDVADASKLDDVKPPITSEGQTGVKGNKGSPLENFNKKGPPRNPPQDVNGRSYSGHALDQMQNRGLMPSVIENTISTGEKLPSKKPGVSVYYDKVNDVSVVLNDQTGTVITVRSGPPSGVAP